MAKLLFSPENHPELTYDDVFLVPHNDVEGRVLEMMGDAKTPEFEELRKAATGPDATFEILRSYRQEVLTYAEAHGIGEVFSRDDVDLTPRGGLANTPVIVANMNNVAGKRMAEAIARVGGIAAIPQDKSDKELKGIVQYLRSRHSVYETPVTVTPDTKVHDLRRLLGKRSHDTAVVENADGTFAGVISLRDLPEGINQDASVENHVRTDDGNGNDIVKAEDGISVSDAIKKMSHVHYLPILNGDKKVVGVLPKIDAAMRLRYTSNLDSVNGGLRAIYTVGALNKNPLDRIRFLLDQGIKDILFDTAHFDQGIQPYRNLEKAADLAANKNVRLNLLAGNVVTREAVRNVILSGAKFVKVGIGPGAMCTTRIETGVGRPQLSAILECADEAKKHGGYVIADGGVQYPRDIALAIAAGADYVMLGSLFAGTYESPPDLQSDEKGSYKVNYGMASTRASVLRTIGRGQRKPMDIFRDIIGHRSEGISEGRVYLKKGKESVALLQHYLLDGPASSISYAAARSIPEFQQNAVIGLQTRSGFMEGLPKGSL